MLKLLGLLIVTLGYWAHVVDHEEPVIQLNSSRDNQASPEVEDAQH